jgi:multiple sugar transport system ATP-binding protein
MGMETLVYFQIGGTEICGRVNPNAGAKDGGPMKLCADLSNMHLIDNTSEQVL